MSAEWWQQYKKLQHQLGIIVLSYPFYLSDVLGVGVFLPRLIVNVHSASAHALDGDCLAIHIDFVSVDRRDGHFGGSVSSPPFNQ